MVAPESGRKIPAAAVVSRDGAVTVRAPQALAGYRMPILMYVDRARDELQRATRLKLGSSSTPLEIIIGGGSSGDTRVLTARLREPSGLVRERIELPDPSSADLELLRRSVAVAFLRAWMVAEGGTDETMRDLPMWVITGLLRHMEREWRQADSDRVLRLWSGACLPAAIELFAFDSLAATQEAAVAATLAAWLVERQTVGSAFEAVLREAAAGRPWQPEFVGRQLAAAEDAAAFDLYLDMRFLAESGQVVRPGVTTAGIVRRFSSHLLLFPSDYGKDVTVKKPWMTFREAMAWAGDSRVRHAAAASATRVKMAAVGRDGTLLAVADAYERFLMALAREAREPELARLLNAAETMLAELERETQAGATLARPGGIEGGASSR